jgi:hypothetical protein
VLEHGRTPVARAVARAVAVVDVDVEIAEL